MASEGAKQWLVLALCAASDIFFVSETAPPPPTYKIPHLCVKCIPQVIPKKTKKKPQTSCPRSRFFDGADGWYRQKGRWRHLTCATKRLRTHGTSEGAPAAPSAAEQVANEMRNDSYGPKNIDWWLEHRAATARYKYEAGVWRLGEPQLPLGFVFCFLLLLFFFFTWKFKDLFSKVFSANHIQGQPVFWMWHKWCVSLKSQWMSDHWQIY